jgi:decaprenylphospho-beta-D-ribofuranose 2-oxidase
MNRADDAAPALQQTRFISFDGAISSSNLHQRPDRYRHLEADLGPRKRIGRGAGLSYSAASFGEGIVVQEMSAFNRLLAFDPTACTVRVEAGFTVGRLLDWAGRNGLCFPVLPGYPLITVGGCIAADVHGKNPLRDGTFCDWVESLTLFHPAQGFRAISRTTRPELFEATCGGFGLTGLIVDATLRLTTQPARNVSVRHVPVESLSESVEELRDNPYVDFGYSWHDGAARGPNFGRGIMFFGRWSDEPCERSVQHYRPMSSAQRGRFPFSLWNRATVRMANNGFRHLAIRRATETKHSFEAAFPFAAQTLYHRFYGRPGLAEAQVLVPDETLGGFVDQLAALVHRIDPLLVMMSVKRFLGRQRSLTMSGTGSLIALDLARTGATSRFLSEFDALVLDMGAQPNVAKDSRLPARVAAGALPHYGFFRERLGKCDPERLYGSELSQRLEL